MEKIGNCIHPQLEGTSPKIIYERVAARGIIMNKEDILLIYTKRYDDYSLPGGGVDLGKGELIEEALIREIAEETGAQNIKVLKAFGLFEELRPIHYPDYDAMHQLSYIFICEADQTLGEATPESYELANGSVAVWVSLDEAIEHNQRVIMTNPKSMGLSIERETAVLRLFKERKML